MSVLEIEMIDFIKWFCFIALISLAIGFVVQGNDFFIFRFFSPKYEQVRRETFEESKAYNEGMAQELRRMQLEYIQASPEQKAAIASVIRHQIAGYDIRKLPADLQLFVSQIQGGL